MAQTQRNRSRSPDSNTVSRCHFPRATLWLQKREPEKAKRLQDLWKDYRKVCNNRSMRSQRGHSTADLDEQVQQLKRNAWLIRNALLEAAQDEITAAEHHPDGSKPDKGESDEVSFAEAELVEPAPKEPDYLYVLQNPLIPGIIKIGRAACPVRRAWELSTCQPFELVVCSSYAGWGFLERILHAKLKHKRVEGGRGREWFSVEPWQVDVLVKAAIVEFELAV